MADVAVIKKLWRRGWEGKVTWTPIGVRRHTNLTFSRPCLMFWERNCFHTASHIEGSEVTNVVVGEFLSILGLIVQGQ